MIILSILIIVLVIVCLYFVLKSTETFLIGSLNDNKQRLLNNPSEKSGSSNNSGSSSNLDEKTQKFLAKLQAQQSKIDNIHARIVPKSK